MVASTSALSAGTIFQFPDFITSSSFEIGASTLGYAGVESDSVLQSAWRK
jgi:hypothetical protein